MSAPFDAGRPDGDAVSDASSGDPGVEWPSWAAEFSTEVRAASTRARDLGSNYCAVAFPPGPTDDVRRDTFDFVSRVMRAGQDEVRAERTPCGGPTYAGCADRFQHHLYKADGYHARELYSLAVLVESTVQALEVVVWVGSSSPGVSIAGLREGNLFGIYFSFAGVCSP
jgi:hypothetical protein